MKKSKKYLIPIAAVAILAAGAYGAQQVSAASDTSNKQTLVDRLASTFGLDKTKVQAVVDADRTAHQADRVAEQEARLTQLVKDGKITEAQKKLIIAEQAKLKAEMDAKKGTLKDETQAQREANRTAKKAEVDAWAKANGIDPQYLGGPGGGHGPGGGRGMMEQPPQ